MNGGPGASSLAGLFGENGPLLLNASGQLTPNPFAWNRHANVLYVEFGPGIGFSYCANSTTAGPGSPCPQASSDCSPCFTSDTLVAEQNAIFLELLLTEKALFPALAHRPLYIAGESYAGVYGPTLARRLLQRASPAINLRGLWVTDPCTDNAAQAGCLRPPHCHTGPPRDLLASARAPLFSASSHSHVAAACRCQPLRGRRPCGMMGRCRPSRLPLQRHDRRAGSTWTSNTRGRRA